MEKSFSQRSFKVLSGFHLSTAKQTLKFWKTFRPHTELSRRALQRHSEMLTTSSRSPRPSHVIALITKSANYKKSQTSGMATGPPAPSMPSSDPARGPRSPQPHGGGLLPLVLK